MQFNFILTPQTPERLKVLPDLLLPIIGGLEAAGHQVIRYGLGLQAAPVVNVVVEGPFGEAFTQSLLTMRATLGSRLLYGVLLTDEEDGADRDAHVGSVIAAANFVWTLLPSGRDRVERIEYGFLDAELDPMPIADPADRDIDVLLYGRATPYRMAVYDELGRRGLTCVLSHRVTEGDRRILPAFLTADAMRRAKVVLDMKRDASARFSSPARVAKALHHGVAVVSEPSADPARLYGYVIPADYATLADRCEQVVRSGLFFDMGRAGQAKFRAETSMTANLAAAMSLPVFTSR